VENQFLKGKGRLKEKVTKPPSSDVDQDTFVEVPLNQTISLQTTNDMRKEKRAITLHVFPTLPLTGVQNIQQGSF